MSESHEVGENKTSSKLRDYYVISKKGKWRALTNSPAKFSWPAFVFGHFWTLYHRAWLLAFAAWLLFFVSSVLDNISATESKYFTIADAAFLTLVVVFIFSWVMFGFQANRLLYLNLNAQGWKFVGTVSASGKAAALEAAQMLPSGETSSLPAPFPLARSALYSGSAILAFVVIVLVLGGILFVLDSGTS